MAKDFKWIIDISPIGLGIPEKIIEMAMNGSGVRDAGGVLGISLTTVAAHLKTQVIVSKYGFS